MKFLKKYAMWCFFITKKAKTQHKHAEKFMKFTARNAVSERSTQVCSISFWKFWCQRSTSLWSAIHWKNRWNFATGREDWHVSCQEIANARRINHVTVWNHLKKAGYAKKLDVWVPHELTQRNLIDRISISETILKRNRPIFEANHYGRWKMSKIQEYRS